MIKIFKYFVLFIVVLGVLYESYRTFSNPLFRSEEVIGERLLTQTPLGTSMDDVIQFLNLQKDWEIRNINYESGYLDRGLLRNKIIGTKSIRVSLGDYRAITSYYLETNVTVFYGFNDDKELIDIWVWKTTDGI